MQKIKQVKKLLLLVLILAIHLFNYAQSTFTTGNIVFLQAEASASNTTANIIEINTTSASQTAIRTIAIDGTGTNALRFSGSATSTGYLSNNNDGTLLCFIGVNNTNTSSNVNTLNPRAVGTLNNALSFNLATTYTGTSGNQTRSATSLDNVNWYIGDQGGLYTNASTIASPSGNIRSVKSFGGTVYAFTASATLAPVNTVSATSGGSLTALPGLASGASSRQDFYLISSGSNGSIFDVLYVSDATTNTAGTIFKYSLVSGAWVDNGSYTTTFGGFGLAAEFGGTGAYLYVSTGLGALTANNIIKLSDVAGYNSTININTSNNINLYTAPSGKIIKGVAFAPKPSVIPTVTSSPNSYSFASTAINSFSTEQTFSLTGQNLSPASGMLTITAPSSNFQVSNDGGLNWNNSTTVNYSGSGATIADFKVRFSPQSSGLKSGNITISGGGLTSTSNVAVTGTGSNALTLSFSANSTIFLNPPYISTTINDSNDPLQQFGIVVKVNENNSEILATDYTLTASSNNTAVVPNANVNISKNNGQATIKINPTAVGYATITLTLTKGGDTKTLDVYCASSNSNSNAVGNNWFTGFSDASSAIAIDDNYMLVCDDEKNQLFVFDRNQSGLFVKSFDFNQGNLMNLTDGSSGAWKELDVEAGTPSPTIAGKSYWLGSMSNSSSFNNKPNRDRIFSINTSGTGNAVNFTNAGFYAGLRQYLINWGDFYGYNFSSCAADGRNPKLINGFNLEGMVFGPDNTTLYFGFRAPLVPTANRTKAVIAPLQNFETWFNNGSPSGNPSFGAPIELDLGGRGIREMIKLSNGIYIIIAGSYDEVLNPAVYRWSGNASDFPQQITSFNLNGLNVEGVLPINEGGGLSLNKLQFISDNGSTIYYGDGIEAKSLTQDNFKKFNSNILSASAGALPINFIQFDATRINNSIQLNWEINGNNELRNFEVLRSLNGIDFSSIGNVVGIIGETNYAFIDKSNISEKVYYRIKAIENFDKNYYSIIKMVGSAILVKPLQVYPNPIHSGTFTIALNQLGDKKVSIYNAIGSLFSTFHFLENQKEISTLHWPKGNYFLQIVCGNGEVLKQVLTVQ